MKNLFCAALTIGFCLLSADVFATESKVICARVSPSNESIMAGMSTIIEAARAEGYVSPSAPVAVNVEGTTTGLCVTVTKP